MRSAGELDALVDELVAVSCSCVHRDHLLDVIRFRNSGHVAAYRLGPCVAAGCPCRGGRP